MKKLSYITVILFLLFSCNNRNIYQIEGYLSDLEDPVIYIVYESTELNEIDTIISNEKGKFSAFHLQDDDLQSITVYYQDRERWFTIYPEAGKPVQVKGDADYPQLVQIKGGRINNKLSEFKKKAAPLLKELADMQRNASLNSELTLKLTNLNQEIRKTVQDFITKNPNEVASVILITDYFSNMEDTDQIDDLLQILSPELNEHYLVKNIRKEIEKAKTTKEGAKAPDFKVTNINGQTFTVDSFANKYFILAFTALWCDMCQTEMMLLDEITTKYPKDSLDILLICLDDELEDIREMVRQDSIPWNLVADSAGQAINLFEIYNVNSLPKCFLMDKEGVIILNTMNGEELKQHVDDVMK